MSFFFRAAACAAVLISTVATMGTGTESVAAMLTEQIAAPLSPDPTSPPDLSTQKMVFVSQPQVQNIARIDPASDASTTDATDATFTTLRDAVANARVDEDLSDAERCLAIAVFYESKGESLTGQMAVARVILNRVASPRFPNTVCGVVTQPSQFSFVRGGRLTEPRAGRQWDTARSVALAAVADGWDSPVGEALFFHATRVSPRWGKTRVATVGNHVFYR